MEDKDKFDKILKITKGDLHIRVINKLICLVKTNHQDIKLLTPLCDGECGCCDSRLACKKVETLYDVSHLFAQFIEKKNTTSRPADQDEKSNLKKYFYAILDMESEEEINSCVLFIKNILTNVN
jgi:hypothetical protein